MAHASTPGPVITGPGHVLRVLALPVGVAALAVIITASFGRPMLGVFLGIGVALGAVNGLLMEQATNRLTPETSPTRKVIVKSSAGRLGLITVIALTMAFVFRPNGWFVLLGLACYQLLTLVAQLQTAAKEARLG